jgi:ABC-type nitrate/sulfonate/bicarbonate transport system substrate-binding protein
VKKTNTLIAMLLIFFSMTFLLNGCAPRGGFEESSEEELTKVTVVLDWVPNTNHTGLYVAKGKGYFSEAGLDVDIVQPTEGGTAQLIAAGQGDFGISYQEEVVIARTMDMPVVAVAAIIQHNTSGFASPVEKGITSPADFPGKKYGGWGSESETAMLAAVMERYGASIDDLEIINIGSADFFSSVERDIDFAWIYYGWAGIEAELRGIELNFILLQDVEPALDFYTPVIIVNEELIAEDPQLISAFLQGATRGYSDAIENPREAAEIFLKHVPELDEELVYASQEYLAEQYQADAPRWGEMKKEIWETYSMWMYDRGLLERQINPEEAFTNEFLPGEQ